MVKPALLIFGKGTPIPKWGLFVLFIGVGVGTMNKWGKLRAVLFFFRSERCFILIRIENKSINSCGLFHKIRPSSYVILFHSDSYQHPFNMKHLKPIHYFLIALVVIGLDQLVKYWVHMNMYEYENIPVFGDWLSLNYQTNPGMAWGQRLSFLGNYDKITLTSFRIVVAILIPFYILKLYKNRAHTGLLLCIAFILAGAVGNLIDSIFYGVLDANLLVDNAIFPALHGKVIDMFYVSIYHGQVPIIGQLDLWPVFNVADASIFCSVIVILAMNKQFFPE